MRAWIVVAVLALGACKSESKTEPKPVPVKIVPTGATPEEAFKNYQTALAKQDLDFLWSFLSNKDKTGDIGQQMAPMNGGNVPAARLDEFAKGFGVTPDEVRKMSKPEFDKHFLWMVMGPAATVITNQKLAKANITGDTAILDLTDPDSKFAMIKEADQWHWDMAGTSAANGH
jgi:hypothetical protein